MSKQKKYDAIVCGGGFRGAISSALLAMAGKSVCLIEASPRLGGVLNSIPWKEYNLDIGCHLFDNSSEQLTKLFFEMHHDFLPVDVTYHSVMAAGKIAKDMAQPDITLTKAEPDKVKHSLMQAIEQNSKRPVLDYGEYLVNRFGEYNASFLRQCCAKKVGVLADQLCPSASLILLMDRVKLLDDTLTRELKKEPEFDSRLALPSAERPMFHYPEATSFYKHRNFYPSKNGMGTFCRALEKYLQNIGVEVIYKDKVSAITENQIVMESGTSLTADKIVWSNELPGLQSLLYNDTSMQNLTHAVSVVLVYFEVPVDKVSDITYVHDYRNNSPCFRISTAGKYGKQISKGNTYICCEIFATKGSGLWDIDEENYKAVWMQVKELNIVNCELPIDVKVIKNPSAYKLPMIGYAKAQQGFLNKLNSEYPNISIFAKPSFSKQHIFEQANEMLLSC